LLGTFEYAVIGIGGFLVLSIVAIALLTEESQTDIFNYDKAYDDLIPRRSSIYVAMAVEDIPQRSCFTINEKDFSELSYNLRSAIHDAQKIDTHYSDSEMYDGVSYRTDSSESLELISKYRFNQSTREYFGSILKISDTTYRFECFFEFHDNQYKLTIEFDGHISDSNIVNVNFTRNEKGLPVIQNQNITVYYGGFNNTVLFHNKLDKEITLTENTWLMGSQETLHHDSAPLKYKIPPGKFASHYFTSMTLDDIVRNYVVEPYDLKGQIIVKHYPRCMTEIEVRSLYSQVGAYPKFPRYIPEGYSFECGIHNSNGYVHLVYFTDELRQQFEDHVNAATNHDFYSAGGFVIDYYNEFIMSNWHMDPTYDKFERAKGIENKFTNSTLINGNPAIMLKEYFWRDGNSYSFNSTQIFLDDQILYYIRGGLSQEEIFKISNSLFNS